MAIRIAVDFNTMMMDPKERVYIAKQGSNRLDDQDALKHMQPGLPVVLHDSEMEVQATVEFDRDYGVWFGKPDWSTRRELSFI